jgi:hypothetical protein
MDGKITVGMLLGFHVNFSVVDGAIDLYVGMVETGDLDLVTNDGASVEIGSIHVGLLVCDRNEGRDDIEGRLVGIIVIAGAFVARLEGLDVGLYEYMGKDGGLYANFGSGVVACRLLNPMRLAWEMETKIKGNIHVIYFMVFSGCSL